MAVVALAVLIPVGIGVVAGIRSYDPGGTAGSTSKEPVRLHTEAGFAELVEAVRAETGSTAVFDAVLYPAYGVVTVPAETRGKRAHSYYYDGDLRRTSQGTTDDPRFDLAQLDPAVMVRLIGRAGTELVEDPTTVYVIVRRPQDPAGGWYSVYATNAYTESGYLLADRTGKVVGRYVSTE